MLEELVAGIVDLGHGRVGLEGPLAGDAAGEVFAGIKELEEAAYCVDVLICEIYLSGLWYSWSAEIRTMQAVSLCSDSEAVNYAGGTLTLPSFANSAQASAKKGLWTRRD